MYKINYSNFNKWENNCCKWIIGAIILTLICGYFSFEAYIKKAFMDGKVVATSVEQEIYDQLKYINESNYENAVVVLDDVLSELDIHKRRSLLNLLKENNQVFITTANKSDVLNIGVSNVQYYEVINGTIKEE